MKPEHADDAEPKKHPGDPSRGGGSEAVEERESARDYRTLYLQTPAMMHSIDREGRIVNVSKLWLSSMGYEAQEVIGRHSVDFLTEESRARAQREVLPQFFRTGACEDVPYQMVKKDGSIIDVLLSAVAERDASGAIVRSLAVSVDVTERTGAVRALRESEQRYQDLLNGVEGIAWEAPSDTLVFSFVSRGAESILGHPEARWLEEPGFWLNHVHPDDRDLLSDALSRAAAGERCAVEYRMFSAREGVVWLRDEIGAAVGSGPPVLLRGVMIDISDQKRARAVIEESERRYREIIESAGVALWVQSFAETNRYLAEVAPLGSEELRHELALHPEYIAEAASRIRVGDVNAETLRLFGTSSKEHLLPNIQTTFVSESYECFREQILAHARGETRFSCETVVQTLGGERRNIIITSVLLPQAEARERALISMVDITERKSLEAQLRHAQKMEAVGQLAGGIAHDFNNLLAVILGRAEILAKLVPSSAELTGHVDLIRDTVVQASQLTTHLLAFSRRQMLQPRVADLNEIVSDTVNMLRRLIGDTIEIVLCLSEDLELVRVDPGQIGQVVVNLALNARDAMPQGGRLLVETFNRRDERGTPSVVLRISDSGHGMDEATRARIFEPFFTTKEAGRGTGLGLATVYGIVEQSGGRIGVKSAPNRGATFEVSFLRAPSTGSLPPPPSEAALVAGDETVLVAEDEAAVRLVTAEVLRGNGYHVLLAVDAKEALQVAAAHEGPIHLLLSDVVMRGNDGPELARKLRATRPEMRLLYMSGYAPEMSALEGTPLLQKPFGSRALLGAVRRVLDETNEEERSAVSKSR